MASGHCSGADHTLPTASWGLSPHCHCLVHSFCSCLPSFDAFLFSQLHFSQPLTLPTPLLFFALSPPKTVSSSVLWLLRSQSGGFYLMISRTLVCKCFSSECIGKTEESWLLFFKCNQMRSLFLALFWQHIYAIGNPDSYSFTIFYMFSFCSCACSHS